MASSEANNPSAKSGLSIASFSRSALRGPRFVEVWWLALGAQISPTPHFSNCRDARVFLAHLAPASRAANQNPAYEVEARGFVRREAEPTIKYIRARKFEDNSFITSHSSSQASQESSTFNLQTTVLKIYLSRKPKRGDPSCRPLPNPSKPSYA